MKKVSFVRSLFFVFISLLAGYFLFGFYYEGADGMHANLFSGVFSDRPFNDFFYIAFVGYGYVLTYLYSMLPSLPWYDILSYLLLLLAGSTVVYVIDKSLAKYNLHFLILLLVKITIVLFLIYPNSLVLNQTRNAIFTSSSGLLLICYLIGGGNDKSRLTRLSYFLGFTLFMSGCLIRLEGGIASLMVFGMSAFLLSSKTVLTLKSFLLPGIILLAIFGLFTLQGMNSEKFVHQVEPDIEYQISGKKNIVELGAMESAADSAKYLMAERWIVNDPEQISIDFLRSIIKKKHNARDRITYTMEIVAAQVHSHLPLNLMMLASVIFFVITFYSNGNKMLSISCLLFAIGVMLLLISMAFFVKMDDRLWVPIVSVTIMIIWFYGIVRSDRIGSFIYPFSIFFIILCMCQVKYFKSYSFSLSGWLADAKWTIEKINELEENDYVLVDLSAAGYTYTTPFSKIKIEHDPTIILHNLGALSVCDQYKSYLDRLCNCNSSNYGEFYSYLSGLQNSLTVIGRLEELKITENYLEHVL